MKILVPAVALTAMLAHDPGELDGDWFNSLRNHAGVSCCGNHHDCDTVSDYQPGPAPGSYRALWHGTWVDVPAYVVLTRSDNPTGLPVLCVMHIDGAPIAGCFVRPAEG